MFTVDVKQQSNNNNNPKYPHLAVVCGQTDCGKSVFVLGLLVKEYQGVFENIVILCPIIEWNNAYKNRCYIADVRRPKQKKRIYSKSCAAGRNRKTSRAAAFVF